MFSSSIFCCHGNNSFISPAADFSHLFQNVLVSFLVSPSACLSVCLPACLTCLSVCLSQALQQFVSSRQTLDLCQLIKVRGRVVCSQQSDAAAFGLRWSSVCPSVAVDVQPVRALPIIPTALLRSLTGINRLPPHATNRRRG